MRDPNFPKPHFHLPVISQLYPVISQWPLPTANRALALTLHPQLQGWSQGGQRVCANSDLPACLSIYFLTRHQETWVIIIDSQFLSTGRACEDYLIPLITWQTWEQRPRRWPAQRNSGPVERTRLLGVWFSARLFITCMDPMQASFCFLSWKIYPKLQPQ